VKRQWLVLGPSTFALAMLCGTTAIAFAGSSGSSAPQGPNTTASSPPANRAAWDNPASHEPGYPGDGGRPYPRDPNSIGPCGVRWGDIYIDEGGFVYVRQGDTNCHVMTKAEVDQTKQAEQQFPNGRGNESSTTTTTP
jgi:hypothetical protein